MRYVFKGAVRRKLIHDFKSVGHSSSLCLSFLTINFSLGSFKKINLVNQGKGYAVHSEPQNFQIRCWDLRLLCRKNAIHHIYLPSPLQLSANWQLPLGRRVESMSYHSVTETSMFSDILVKTVSEPVLAPLGLSLLCSHTSA